MLKFARIRSIRKFSELYKPGDAYSTIQPGIVFINEMGFSTEAKCVYFCSLLASIDPFIVTVCWRAQSAGNCAYESAKEIQCNEHYDVHW